MGGEQSRPGTQRIPPPAVLPASAPLQHAGQGRLYCTPEDMLALMAGGGAPSPWLSSLSGSAPDGAPMAQMVHAQQLRCDAVVAPDTLRLSVDAARPQRLLLAFDFSSHAPVEAAVTYLCICRRSPADPSPLGLLSRLPRSPLRHVFPAGPAHHFSQGALAAGTAAWSILPREDGAGGGAEGGGAGAGGGSEGSGSSAEEGLDLTQVTLRELTHRPQAFAGCGDLLAATRPPPPPPPPLPATSLLASALDARALAALEIPQDMCPLLVTLTVLDAEGRPAVPTRLQATLCCISPDRASACGWKVTVLVQLFQAGSQVYKTQTLFGDRDSGAGASAGGGGGGGGGGAAGGKDSSEASTPGAQSVDEGLINGSDCVICLSEPRTTALLPCRHLCLCAPCAQQLRLQSNKCPICRSPTTSLLTWGH